VTPRRLGIVPVRLGEADVLADGRSSTLTVTLLKDIDELKAGAGSHLSYSQWPEIIQDRVNQFADATDDRQWIHVDVERARCPHPASG
jgi:acyl dehydratase